MLLKKADWDNLWKSGFTYGPLIGWEKEIFLAISGLIGDLEDAKILSAGCGRGLVDYWLMLVFGFHVTLLDQSKQSIKNLKSSLRHVDSSFYKLIHGSILQLPQPQNSFDLVWNEGVLEHFSDEEFEQALSEMVRVSRRYVVIDVPNANCRPYMVAKEWLEKNGRWSWGYEKPRTTLRPDFERLGVRVLEEKSIGGQVTTRNYLNMVPAEHRQPLLDLLEDKDFAVFPHLLIIGEVNERTYKGS